MPDDTNNPMEQRLQEYAQERRRDLGEPLELHPATRKLLQDEAARTHGAAAGSGTSTPWFIRYWPRLAFGGAIVGTLAFVMAKVMPPQHKLEMVMTEQSMAPTAAPAAPVAAPAAAAPLPTAAPPPPAEDRLAKSLAGTDAPAPTLAPAAPPAPSQPVLKTANGPQGGVAMDKEVAASKLAEANRPVPPPAAAPSAEALADSQLRKAIVQKDVKATEPAPTRPTATRASADAAKRDADTTLALAPAPSQAPRPAATSDPKGATTMPQSTSAVAIPGRQLRTQEITTASNENQAAAQNAFRFANTAGSAGQNQLQGQRFSQTENTFRRNFNSPPLPPVLNNFELTVAGEHVTITDADGSVYEGSLQPVAMDELQARKEAPTKRQGGAVPASKPVTVPSVQNFQVTGTNRTLNQAVIFTGSVSLPTVTGGNMASRLQEMLKQEAESAEKARVGPANTANVQGRAIVGGTQQIEIRAAPLSR